MKEFTKSGYQSGGYYHQTITIYGIKHPVTSELFYVGQTKKPLSDRLHGHISSAKKKYDKFRNELKDNYILDLLKHGLRPKMKTIEKIRPISFVEYLEISEKEVAWMRHFQKEGHNIMNIVGLRVPQLNAKYMIYKEQVQAKSVEMKYYFAGFDKHGVELYHKERIISDGGVWIDKRIPIIPEYNPFQNERFLKKNGL